MNFSNSLSSIISSFQVCTRSLVSSFSVMSGDGLAPVNPEVVAAVNPVAEAPEILPENRDQAAASDEVGFQVLEAELNSLKKAMLEVTAVDSEALNIHKISSVDDLDEEDVAKAQLKVPLGIQSVVTRQYKTQQNALTAQMVASRTAENCSQILGYHLKSMEAVMKNQSKMFEGVEQEIKHLSAFMERDVNVGQNVVDSVETTMDRVSTALGGFAVCWNTGRHSKGYGRKSANGSECG